MVAGSSSEVAFLSICRKLAFKWSDDPPNPSESASPSISTTPYPNPHSMCVCVCCTLFQWLLCLQNQLLELSVLCLIKTNGGVCECSLPSCTSSTIIPSASIQVTWAAHSAPVRKCSFCILGGYWCVQFPSVIEQRWRFRWWWPIIRYKQLCALWFPVGNILVRV